MFLFHRPNSTARSADFHTLRLSKEACSIPDRFGPFIEPQSVRMDRRLGNLVLSSLYLTSTFWHDDLYRMITKLRITPIAMARRNSIIQRHPLLAMVESVSTSERWMPVSTLHELLPYFKLTFLQFVRISNGCPFGQSGCRVTINVICWHGFQSSRDGR